MFYVCKEYKTLKVYKKEGTSMFLQNYLGEKKFFTQDNILGEFSGQVFVLSLGQDRFQFLIMETKAIVSNAAQNIHKVLEIQQARLLYKELYVLGYKLDGSFLKKEKTTQNKITSKVETQNKVSLKVENKEDLVQRLEKSSLTNKEVLFFKNEVIVVSPQNGGLVATKTSHNDRTLGFFPTKQELFSWL